MTLATLTLFHECLDYSQIQVNTLHSFFLNEPGWNLRLPAVVYEVFCGEFLDNILNYPMTAALQILTYHF